MAAETSASDELSTTAGGSTCTSSGSLIIKTTASSASLCQECQQESFLYQCPRCAHRTCSLHCCLAHKERTGCNGKRDRTKFLPKARMHDGTLTSDYHFLEDVLGAMERAKRTVGTPNLHNNGPNKRFKHADNMDKTPHSMLQQIENLQVGSNSNNIQQENHEPVATPIKDNNGSGSIFASTENSSPIIAAAAANPNPTLMMTNTHNSSSTAALPATTYHQLGPKWRHFWQQAKLRGTNLLLMPSGMQRRKANSSHIKKDVIWWKVDIRIHSLQSSPSAPPTVQSRKLSELSNLWEELQKVDFMNVMVHDGDNDSSKRILSNPPTKVHWLLQKLPSPSNRPCYIELDICSCGDKTLQSILKGMTLIEYPTIEVVPSSRLSEFPKAIEELP